MRIALLTDGIWPYVLGGMQKHSYYLCKYLAQQKVSVDLYHFNQSSYDIEKMEVFTDEERKYITSVIINFPKSKVPFPGHYVYNSYKHSQLIFEALKDKIAAYDFIYTKGFTGWYLIQQKFNKAINCAPIGVKFHGYEMFQKPPDLKTKMQHMALLRKPVKEISQKADVVFSYGGKITDIIRSIGVDEKKIFELPSGVESSAITEEITPVSEKIRFLYLGRYERRKGIEELNRAIHLVLKTEHSKTIEFNFIGPIPVDKRIQHDAIFYHGEIRSKEGLELLVRKCDVLICPSWSEGMPNVILEAMASGLAVIATDVGATNVLVNDNTGWLLKNPDPAEIQAAIEAVVNGGAASVNQKKQNALDLIRNTFVWEKLITKFLQSGIFRVNGNK